MACRPAIDLAHVFLDQRPAQITVDDTGDEVLSITYHVICAATDGNGERKSSESAEVTATIVAPAEPEQEEDTEP